MLSRVLRASQRGAACTYSAGRAWHASLPVVGPQAQRSVDEATGLRAIYAAAGAFPTSSAMLSAPHEGRIPLVSGAPKIPTWAQAVREMSTGGASARRTAREASADGAVANPSSGGVPSSVVADEDDENTLTIYCQPQEIATMNMKMGKMHLWKALAAIPFLLLQGALIPFPWSLPVLGFTGFIGVNAYIQSLRHSWFVWRLRAVWQPDSTTADAHASKHTLASRGSLLSGAADEANSKYQVNESSQQALHYQAIAREHNVEVPAEFRARRPASAVGVDRAPSTAQGALGQTPLDLTGAPSAVVAKAATQQQAADAAAAAAAKARGVPLDTGLPEAAGDSAAANARAGEGAAEVEGEGEGEGDALPDFVQLDRLTPEGIRSVSSPLDDVMLVPLPDVRCVVRPITQDDVDKARADIEAGKKGARFVLLHRPSSPLPYRLDIAFVTHVEAFNLILQAALDNSQRRSGAKFGKMMEQWELMQQTAKLAADTRKAAGARTSEERDKAEEEVSKVRPDEGDVARASVAFASDAANDSTPGPAPAAKPAAKAASPSTADAEAEIVVAGTRAEDDGAVAQGTKEGAGAGRTQSGEGRTR